MRAFSFKLLRLRRLLGKTGFLLLVAALPAQCLEFDCASADAFCDPLLGTLLYSDLESRPEFLYFIRSGSASAEIYRYSLAASTLENLGGVFSGSPAAMAIDRENGWLYYAVDSDSTIRRARLDGSENTAFVTDASAGEPIGLVVDADRNRFYWWNSLNELRFVNLDGSGTPAVVRAYGANILVGAYATNENLWYVGGGPEVRRMPDDGLSDTQINNAGANIIDLELIDSNRLVVSDIGDNEIVRMNRDGSNRAVLQAIEPGGTAYNSATSTLYSCNQNEDRIQTIDMQTGAATTLLQFDATFNPVACAL